MSGRPILVANFSAALSPMRRRFIEGGEREETTLSRLSFAGEDLKSRIMFDADGCVCVSEAFFPEPYASEAFDAHEDGDSDFVFERAGDVRA